MYICKDSVCDSVCDFCWYCIHGDNGEPIQCEKMKMILKTVWDIVINLRAAYMNQSHLIVEKCKKLLFFSKYFPNHKLAMRKERAQKCGKE